MLKQNIGEVQCSTEISNHKPCEIASTFMSPIANFFRLLLTSLFFGQLFSLYMFCLLPTGLPTKDASSETTVRNHPGNFNRL